MWVIDQVFEQLLYHCDFADEQQIQDEFSFKDNLPWASWNIAHTIVKEELRFASFLERSVTKDIEILKKLCQQESIVRDNLLYSDQEILRKLNPVTQTPEEMFRLLDQKTLFKTDDDKKKTLTHMKTEDIRKYGNFMNLLWSKPTEKNIIKVLDEISSDSYSNEDDFKEFFIRIYWKATLCKKLSKLKGKKITRSAHVMSEQKKRILKCLLPVALALWCVSSIVLETIVKLKNNFNQECPVREIPKSQSSQKNIDDKTLIWDEKTQQRITKKSDKKKGKNEQKQEKTE